MFLGTPTFNHVKRFKGPPFLHNTQMVRRMKEQKRKNKTKKRKVLSRQAKEVCKLLTGNGEIDITQKASIPVIDSNNLNREALHTKLRKRFHLEPLKQLKEQGYISDCVIITGA